MEGIKRLLMFSFIVCSTASYLETVCKLPMDLGESCDEAQPLKHYYFDTIEERCVSFNYLGCKGNENRFNNSNDCIDNCQMAWYMKKNKEELDPDQNIAKLRQKSDCQLKPERGNCKALITMYFYDPENKTCLVFGYGGCGGNLNRFDNQIECENFCIGNVTLVQSAKLDRPNRPNRPGMA